MDSEIQKEDDILKNNNENINNSMFFGVITSLKLFKDKYLFAGTGNFLSVFNIQSDEKLEKKIKIFISQKISKINIFPFINIREKNNYLLTLSGETKIKFSFYSENELNFQFNEISTKSNDYIMDHILFSHSDKKYLTNKESILWL